MAEQRFHRAAERFRARFRFPARLLLRGGLDLLLPKTCFACGAGPPAACPPLEGLFCARCAAAIRMAGPGCCPVCGERDAAALRCRRCGGSPGRFAFDRCAAGAAYSGIVQELVHRIKFAGDSRAAFPLGRLARLGAERALNGSRADAVAAVPLHPLKRLRRGYNQAELIARVVARELGVPYRDGLVRRIRRTPSQGAALPGERRTNLRGAFSPTARLRREAGYSVRGSGLLRHVLLVDDVVSTAATLHHCARALKEGGVLRVTGAAAAT